MSAVTRLDDVCSGHGAFPPRKAISASTTVFANSMGIVRVDDKWETHCAGPSCHDSVSSKGSSKVFVNGKPAVRIGDEIACGSLSAQGSETVFFG